VTKDSITLKRASVVDNTSQRNYVSSMKHTLLIYTMIGVASLFLGLWLVVHKTYLSGILLLVVGLVCLINVVMSRNNSATDFVRRSSVQIVKAHAPHPPFSRPYFSVYFTENSKTYKRLIMLPGSLSGGNEEYKKALSIMIHFGWLDG
jgi:hypothetical protein